MPCFNPACGGRGRRERPTPEAHGPVADPERGHPPVVLRGGLRADLHLDAHHLLCRRHARRRLGARQYTQLRAGER